MRHHANRGREWQAIVEDQHAFYAREGRCAWIRNEPTRTGQFAEEDILRGKGPPDYTVWVRGACFTVETKDHRGERWPLSEVSRYQAARMDSIVQQDAAALILLRLGGRVFLIQWPAVASDWYLNRGLGVVLTPDDPRMIEVYGTDYLGTALGLLPTSQHRPFHQD